MKKKIGLYFGSFNPVHVGHLIIANSVLQTAQVDEVWLVITPHNPHKEKKTLLADNQRMQILLLAIGDNTKIKVSDIEFKLPQPNYTINTLAHLTNKYPAFEFKIIMGADNLQSIEKWFEYKRILDNYSILVYPRPGFEIKENLYKNIHVLDNVPFMEISATAIRNLLKNKQDASYYIPTAALAYIKEMHFYEK